MKYFIYFCFLTCFTVWSQENVKKDYYLDAKHEIRFSYHTKGNNRLSEILYEQQITNFLSLGVALNTSLVNNDNFFYDEDENYNYGIDINARYYIKDYITNSFYYLLFDHDVKSRYFVEGAIGFNNNRYKYTQRYLDSNNDYVLELVNESKNAFNYYIGFGQKIVFYKNFSLNYSFGTGTNIIEKSSDGYGYFKFGLGYRF